jgi:sugar O-acyltransferase (sialic acid O-acetyltransferase NeuD family)
MVDVVIVGAGGQGRETCWIFEEANQVRRQFNVLGFVDNDPNKLNTIMCDLPVLGNDDWLRTHLKKTVFGIVAIGSSPTRRTVVKRLESWGYQFCSVVHPSAAISKWVEIGPGSIIASTTVITTQVKIGRHVLVNYGTTIGHDTEVGDFCNLGPGCHLSGSVLLKEGVDLGTGVNIIPGVHIGSSAIIGAGAAVVNDIPGHVSAVGVPCRVIKRHQQSRPLVSK